MKGIALACAVALSLCLDATAGQPVSVMQTASESATPWVYQEQKDEMRGAIQYTASTESLNSIELPFPYSGGSNMTLAIRKTAAGETQVMMFIKKGQIACAYDECTIALKFDDHPIYRASAEWASGGATDCVFIENASAFLKRLRASRRLIAELQIYNAGTQQFKFDTAALKWVH